MKNAKIVSKILTSKMVVAAAFTMAITTVEVGEDATEVAAYEAITTSNILKTIECTILEKCHYLTECTVPKKNHSENSNMVSIADFKNMFQSSLMDMMTKKEKQNKKKENMDIHDKYFDIHVFSQTHGR
jgi:hypothetical protein